MKLPNANFAIVDREKLYDYCLNQDHPRGKHKARVFQSTLGLTSEHTDELIAGIKKCIKDVECKPGESDEYGQRYFVDIDIERNNKKAAVRTAWIVKKGESQPRLTTCYVK